MKNVLFLFVGAIISICSYSQINQSCIVINNIRIIDGSGDKGVSNILIKNDKIEAIDSLNISGKGCKIIDGKGKSLLPGIIEAHAHVTMVPAENFHLESESERLKRLEQHLRAYLAWGITTVVDPGISYESAKLVDSLTQKIPSPEVRFIGPLLGPKHGYPSVADERLIGISTKEEIADLMDEFRDLNPDGIKVTMEDGLLNSNWPLHSDEMQQHIVDEAESRNQKIFVHAMDAKMTRQAFKLKPHAMVHGSKNGGKNLANELIEKNIYVVSTLGIYGLPKLLWDSDVLNDSMVMLTVPQDELDAFCNPVVRKSFIDSLTTTIAPKTPFWLGRILYNKAVINKQYKKARNNLRKMNKHGVKLVMGSDAVGWPIFPYSLHGHSTHMEIDYLTDAGMTPLEIIKSFSQTSAEMLGIFDSIGSVDIGKKANLIIIDGNPLEDIRLVHKPKYIINKGVIGTSEEWMNSK